MRTMTWRRPTRRTLLVLGVAIALVAGGTTTALALTSGGGSTTTGSGRTAVDTAGFPSGPHQVGIFTDHCGYSHEAADDPILAPNQPGRAMHHDFYGNTTTSASSTASKLVGGATTCSTSADSSAYWTPVLYQHGNALTPSSALIYWTRPVRSSTAVQSIPVGLQMIAGDESATSPQPLSVVAWTCRGTQSQAASTTTPHDCPGSALRVVVHFPDCWDGKSLDGAGQTDVVYDQDGRCPATHPIEIPQLVFHVNYPTASAAGLTLSMTPTMQGSTDTEHVDFINGWSQTVLDRDVQACDATRTRCGPVTGAQAVPHGPAPTRTMRPRHRH